MNKNLSSLLTIAIVIAAMIGLIYGARYWSAKRNAPASDYTAFAQCLASKGLTMYGAEWCPHCKREKALFGAAWKYVPYVECPENEKLCLAKGVNGYPTWIAKDGTKYEGEQGLEGLSRISSCPLPDSK